MNAPPPLEPEPKRPPVIGLAGGIGAGKSTAARAFESRGCIVIDSDARAKAALDRPDVRETLVHWWGDDVIGRDGRIDRGRIASIIFSDPAQRERLEHLVHPIVREDRAAMIAQAELDGAPAVIVDAPLLFEAGVDAECDFVVFVDAPRDIRLDRVHRTRGWDQHELDRREQAQLPLDQKRAKSRYVVDNSGDSESVQAEIDRILSEVAI